MNAEQFLSLIQREKREIEQELIKRRPWHNAAVDLLAAIMRREDAKYFMESPVKMVASYSTVVRSPMWLSKVHTKLHAYEYSEPHAFLRDMRLIFENCYLFHDAPNGSKELIKAAAVLEIEFEHQAVAARLDEAANTTEIRKLWVNLDKNLRTKASQTIMMRYNESVASIKNEATRKRLLLFLKDHMHSKGGVRSEGATSRLPPPRAARDSAHIDDNGHVEFHEAPVEKLPQNEHRYTVDFVPMRSAEAQDDDEDPYED
ncbi:Hypothetical protein, putative [Bodo saltans]|uniref:Bromo domain-containing protein n=1 Tax=Bodo saltans TaxID=75058 RepID=A0A0S4KI88_BODSA|nr:Hypothetical protein, putative [Bodo saltans]|eukprot:CUI15349.1 Hypothetical protein, putative [Bodo saltans]